MVRIPISRAVRATRIAISPRFAIKSRRNIRASSERNVGVFLRRPGLSFRPEDRERVDHAGPRLLRFDHIVEVSHTRSDVWVREAIAIFAHEFLLPPLRVLRLLDFLLEDDLDRALGTHDGDLRGRPSEA